MGEGLVTMTFSEKSELRDVLLSFVERVCNNAETMPLEVLRVLPAVLEQLLGYYGR